MPNFPGSPNSDSIIGSDFDDVINGQAGNDTIRGNGGNDVINPGSAFTNGRERIFGSIGDDQYIFSDVIANGSYIQMTYFDRAGITVNINGLPNTGSVQKANTEGTDTFINIATALNNGYFELFGTDGNDTFTLNGTNGSFIGVGGGRGNDTYNLTLSGEILLIYDGSWTEFATQGLILNLATGVVANDGFGFTDFLNISNTPTDDYISVLATNLSDRITGSARAKEVYTLGGGNDTLAAGDGFDQLRYDRIEMTSGVTVDLQAGTATGSWDGQAFSHTLSGLEFVRGTNNFGDTLRGGTTDDEFDGYSGNDLIDGRGGDDELYAGDGNDTVIGGVGADYIEGGNGNDRIDASQGNRTTERNGDQILPGTGTNTILGNADLFLANNGIDVSYEDVEGSGGLIVTRGVNGSTTVQSRVAGVVNDTITFLQFLDGTLQNDTFVGQQSGSGTGISGWAGLQGDDVITGGIGEDFLSFFDDQFFTGGTSGISVTFSAIGSGTAIDGFGDTDTFTGIEGIGGTDAGDVVNGSDGAERVYAEDGNDQLNAGGGNDSLNGGRGADTLNGGAGNDVLNGGSKSLDALDLLNYPPGSDPIDDLGDLINGGSGDDTIDGGAGDDTMLGGADDDTFVVNSAGDAVFETTTTLSLLDAGGLDTVQSAVTFSLDSSAGVRFVENLVLTGTANINGTGNALANQITGNTAANVLTDGAGAGIDTLTGLGGNDTYVVRNATTQIVEAAGQGTADRVAAGVSFVLAADDNIEVLTTSSSSGTTAINLTGNALAQAITGNAGANVLHTGGGTGVDTLTGLGGNDTYRIYVPGAVIVESAGQGTADRVTAAVSFALAADDDIEVMTTSGSTGTGAINLTGNGLAQAITGNAGVNVLADGGGAGVDTLTGLGGNDTYRIANTASLIVESAGQGTADRVMASVSFTLAADDDIEVMTTNGSTGTAAINLTGNALAQAITGNAGANVLSDGGGAGADTMTGLGGNDTYIIRNAGTVIIEGVGQGTADRVAAGVSFTLAADDDIEVLRTSSMTATTAINLTGNGISQTVEGNDGANRLNGGGGNDVLTGRGGADTFVFTSALGAGNIDEITDFSVVADTIELESAIFTGLANGTLTAAAFRLNATGLAEDATDRIMYDSATGNLYFDADGNGAGARVQFAVLDSGLALTTLDLLVV